MALQNVTKMLFAIISAKVTKFISSAKDAVTLKIIKYLVSVFLFIFRCSIELNLLI